MKKINLILSILCLAKGADLQEFYKSRPQIWTIDWISLGVVVSIILIMILAIFLVLKPKKVESSDKKQVVQKIFDLKKIEHKDYDLVISQNDIARIMVLYFGILRIKAADNSNKFMFDLDPQIKRYYEADFINLSYVLFGICDFLSDNLRETSVIISVQNCDVGLEFSLKIFAPLDGEKIQNVLAGKKETISYKMLQEAVEYSRLLRSSIFYDEFERGGEFSFEIEAKPIDTAPDLNFALAGKALSAVIKTKDELEFAILKRQLEFFGVKVEHECDLSIADRLISDGVFKPDFVFIDAHILDAMSVAEVKKLIDSKKIKKFDVIITASNEDSAQIENEKVPVLKHPYIIDELLAFLNKNQGVDENALGGKFLA